MSSVDHRTFNQTRATLVPANLGTNAGVVALTGTTAVVVSAPGITATSPVLYTLASAPAGAITVTKGAGSFTIVSNNAGDTMDVNYIALA